MERLAPRAGTALLMVVFAAVSTPETVGYYAAVMTGYAVLQSLSDGAAKRTATVAVSSQQGMRFLRRYRFWYGLLGTGALMGTLSIVSLWGASLQDTLTFVPLIVLPLIMGSSIVPLARLQRAGKWRTISMLSSGAALLALCVGLPLVVIFQNAVGSVCQLVLTEALFAVGLHAAGRRLPSDALNETSPTNLRAQYWAAAGFVSSLQGQYQLDRVTVGAFGGPAILGVFNLGWSLSRTFTDSFSTSTLNVIQARVLDGRKKKTGELSRIIMHALPRALVVTSAVIVAIYIAARFVAPLILGREWDPMLEIVPLMSASAVPALICYVLLPPLMYLGRMRWAIVPRILGLGFSLVVGVAVTQSLALAVWIAMAREIFAMLLMYWSVRREISARVVAVPLIVTGGVCLLIWVADLVVLG